MSVEELVVPLHPVYRESGSIPVLVKILKVVSHLPLLERFTVAVNSQDSHGAPVCYKHQRLQTQVLQPFRGIMNTTWGNRALFRAALEADFDELTERVTGEIQRQMRNEAEHQQYPLTFA